MQTVDCDETMLKANSKEKEGNLKSITGSVIEHQTPSNRKRSSAKKSRVESLDKTLSKSGLYEISASKKDFMALLQKLEKAEDCEERSLFYFQPVIANSEDKFSKPYLPAMAKNMQMKYTLVLDLDETLVHFEENEDRSGGQFHIRPFAIEFLKQMSNHFELVIFTAALKEVNKSIILVCGLDFG